MTGAFAAPSRSLDRLARLLGVAFVATYCGAIAVLGDRLLDVPHLPDTGPGWYYWKLAEPTLSSRAVVWGLYAAHQLANFWLIAHAQSQARATISGLHPFNVWALGLNALFVLVHLGQSHLTYDGLAQDVHVFSSLASVAVLLVWVLLMENGRRGLFVGRKAPLSSDVVAFARKYHGYFFSWAIVYTFWYHPAEATPGHLMGFFYLLLILLQGSLFFTRAHTEIWWTTTLEVMVLGHGTMVAVMQGQGLWPMFFFGFGAMFVFTQAWGLAWPKWSKVALVLAWATGAAVVYAGRGVGKLNEVIRIPFIDYVGVFVLTGVLWLGLRAFRARQVG